MNDIKIGVFGNSACEKTQLTLRFLHGDSANNYQSNDFEKTMNIDGNTINLTIFDNAGQDEFNEMRFLYYSKIQAAILVIDISNMESINAIKSIYQEIQNSDTDTQIHFAVAANRGYLRDQKSKNLISVDAYKGLEYFFNCKVFETNTKTGQNVDDIFHYLIRQCLNSNKVNSKNTHEKKKRLTLIPNRNMQNSSEDLNDQSKDKFPSKKDKRKSQMIDRAKLQASSSDFVKKRSVSIVPKMMTNDSNNISQPLEVFTSPIGDEIKKVLQSRTKQLQQALEEKKQLEIIVKQKDDELRKALDRIKELESMLSNNNGC